MGTVRYTVIDGEVVSELRGGVKRDYVPDPLGSTVALRNDEEMGFAEEGELIEK